LTVSSIIAAAFAAFILQQPASPQPAAPPPTPPTAQQPAAQQSAAAVPPALATQVMLDRAGFSPGVIDGKMGRNTRRALEAFERQQGNLPAATDAPLIAYAITEADAAGPYVPQIPEDMVEKSKLPALAYTSIVEALAERFHTTPALLQQLNPGAAFQPGATIQVPNVQALEMPAADAPKDTAAAKEPQAKPTGTAGRDAASKRSAAAEAIMSRPDVVVTVTESTSDLTVKDTSGRVVMYAPVTTGSKNDPLPIGTWKVKGAQLNPKFHYNPDLFWDADPSHSKATLPAGPNSPVGVVWIDLSKPHYGIHGTPEPSTIGRTESHGCIRLTNWDALRLAGLVKPGTQVVFAK
jgi:lipoprotein-anchoring transpeptidase ErfK/SrfK